MSSLKSALDTAILRQVGLRQNGVSAVIESSSSLLQRTREMLIARPRTLTLRRIAAETGIDKSFLSRVGREDFDPGVIRVQCLYEFLSGRKLKV